MRIQKQFSFDAAHYLPHAPDGHPNRRLHGHSFRVIVCLDGMPDDATGLIRDFGDVNAQLMDVREELDRLLAHITSARDLLSAGSPVGRKLDFLSQEFNREANTLCSKSSDSSLTAIGLSLKNTVDQFREQIQNVE